MESPSESSPKQACNTEGLLEIVSVHRLSSHTPTKHVQTPRLKTREGARERLLWGLPQLGGHVQDVGQISCQGLHQVLAHNRQALEDELQQLWLCLRPCMPRTLSVTLVNGRLSLHVCSP